MSNLYKKSFTKPDDFKKPDKAVAEIVNMGSVMASKVVAQPGWKWSESIKPLVGGDSCQAPHLGVVTQGSLHVVHDDGTELTINAGDVFACSAGHDAWVIGDVEVIIYEFNNSGKDWAVWTIG
jgi:hypothetical protein